MIKLSHGTKIMHTGNGETLTVLGIEVDYGSAGYHDAVLVYNWDAHPTPMEFRKTLEMAIMLIKKGLWKVVE